MFDWKGIGKFYLGLALLPVFLPIFAAVMLGTLAEKINPDK